MKIYHVSYNETWRYGGWEDHDFIAVAESEEAAIKMAIATAPKELESLSVDLWCAEEVTPEESKIIHVSTSHS